MLEDSFTELERNRLDKLHDVQADGLEPYPTRAEQTNTSQEAIDAFTKAEEAGDETPIKVTLAGRLRSLRTMARSPSPH